MRTTYSDFNSLGIKRPQLQLGIERLLLGGVLRPLVGVGLTHVSFDDFTGQFVGATNASGNSVQATEQPTLYASPRG